MSPLVMESDQIPDSSITASSVVSTTDDTDVPESGDEKLKRFTWYLCSEWSLGADWLIATGDYPGFCSMKRIRVLLLPPGRNASPLQVAPTQFVRSNNSPVPVYTPGWREALWELSVLPKNKTQCPWSGLEPEPLDRWTSALIMRPQVPYNYWI